MDRHFYVSFDRPETRHAAQWSSHLLILGAITMPLVCYLSAFIKPFRHLFFIPVTSLILAVAFLIIGVLFK
ncbi:MAG: hypothetical protein HZB26_18755 [Candidatus Hydrogenedentes bacterium]|nr:hypothetical protein [Candidatus Hydrogenedentota bacterium]